MDIDNAVDRVVKAEAQVVEGFKVGFDSTEGDVGKSFFANGRMQVAVMVTVTGLGLTRAFVENNVKLIGYNGGQLLRQPWVVSRDPNQYVHELNGGSSRLVHVAEVPDPGEFEALRSLSETRKFVVVFWVSSAVIGTTRVAAQVGLYNGTVVKSDGVRNPVTSDVFDSSVTLSAIRPVVYDHRNFFLTSERVGGEQSMHRLYRYHLGLTPGGRHISLMSWSSNQYADGGTYNQTFFESGQIANTPGTTYFTGVLADTRYKYLSVNLPGGSGSGHYTVDVNNREGQLTVVQALSAKGHFAGRVRHAVFRFSVIDMYGTEHKLSIRTDINARDFILENG